MRMPRLRFRADDGSEFPDWEERTSVELCSRMIGGGTPSTSNTDNYNGDISWISSSDLDVDNITTVRRTRFITEGAIATSATKKIKPGSIAVVLRVGVGKVALLDLETCTSQDFISLEDVTGDTKFIAYMLSARMQREAVRTQGTSIKGIPATRFKELTYRMPSSIIEQRKIADLLSTVDDAITAQQAEVDAWEQRKKGVMQKLFSQEVRFKADDGFDYPDWEEKTLGNEGTFYGGLSGKAKSDFQTGKACFITYMNVYKNPFARQDMMGRVDVGIGEKQNKVQYGDLLFTQSSETVEEVGLSSVYLYDDKPYLNSFCMGYRFNDLKNVCPEFMGYCMRSDAIRRNIMLMGQGISRINLSAKRLGTVSYRIPSLFEQRKIADCLSSLDDVIVKAKTELAKWQELKKGLLQQMFI